MYVRCWVIVGDSQAARRGMLLPTESLMEFRDHIPNAADYQPGQWIVWQPAMGNSIALVCVEIPLP